MKKYLLLMGLIIGILVSQTAFAGDKNKDDENELLKKSRLTEPANFNVGSSFPKPFDEIGAMGNPGNAAISTGYYWVDSDDAVGAPHNPGSVFPHIVDTNVQAPLWNRILPGPRIVPQSFWANSDDGYYFFRNPMEGANIWTNPVDSTDNAIAGPIPLGIRGGFFFNGIRYDSFYVSTNGVIALSNRRYFYDSQGNRTIPPGASTCYDPMSQDWFIAFEGSQRDRQYLRDPGTGNFVRDDDGNRIRLDGLNDPVRDDFGFAFSVLGYNPIDITQAQVPALMYNGFFTTEAVFNTNLPENRKTAIIAPFWGDMHLSQWHEESETVEDFGRVYYRRSIDGDSLIISYHRIQPKGNLQASGNTFTSNPNIRAGEPNFLSATGHVILSGKDSSITFYYQLFAGQTTSTGRALFAWEAIRSSCIAGVRGFARHVNYGRPGGQVQPSDERYPWHSEYPQNTWYFFRYNDGNQLYPQTGFTVKFKQWMNALRVADIQYRIRTKDPDDDLEFKVNVPSADVDNYELLAGEERIGAIQPVALIQNLTNEIQGPSGVNFVQQSINFRGRFRINSMVTGQIVYNRLVPIDALCMGLDDDETEACNGDPLVRVNLVKTIAKAGANYNATPMTGEEFRSSGFNGVPPYYFVQVAFPPFQPNEFVQNHIGRHRAFIIAEPRRARSTDPLGGRWPFDDTASVRLYVLNRITPDNTEFLNVKWPFEDDGTQFHVDLETGVTIPSAYKWVNLNAELVTGEQVSMYPLPPRGEFRAMNQTSRIISSPTIKMNRTQIGGAEPDPKYAVHQSRNGDELISFPIDMRGMFGSTLSLSIQRTTKQDDWTRGWCDEVLLGPEPRTIVNGSTENPFNVFNIGLAASNLWDEIIVEFAKPSNDGLNEITNITLYHKENWRHHPFPRGVSDPAVTDMPALTVFGAGGYMTGFMENNTNMPYKQPSAPASKNGMRANIYDDGVDWEFKKYFVPIPDTLIRWRNEGAKNFRFRIKVAANLGGPKNPLIPSLNDDQDDFYVDNVRITRPSEITDIEVNSVKILWPYTLVPATQASKIPVFVNISNNTNLDASSFSVKVKIFRTSVVGGNVVEEEEPIYCRIQTINNLKGNSFEEIQMQSWDARKSQLAAEQTYRMYGIVIFKDGEKDLIPENDTNFTDVTIRISDVFAYDPPDEQPQNNVGEMVGPGGRGLNLFGTNFAGSNANPGINMRTRAGADPAGGDLNLGSGSIAMKINLMTADTIRGFRAVFGSLNMSPDWIYWRVLQSSGQTPGSQEVPNTFAAKLRLRDDITGNLSSGAWVTYLLDEPVQLDAGDYWVSISQSGQTGLELGASAARSGGRVTHYFVDPGGTWGTVGTTLLLDKNFRQLNNAKNWENLNLFAYENTIGSNNWVQFTPTVGRWSYAHRDYRGFHPQRTDNTLANGTWLPMIRPYFGQKAYGTAPNDYQWCIDDIPVELISFEGTARQNAIDLYWETASESLNSGFIVQRKLANQDEKDWVDLGFVQGKGNSNIVNRYNYNDKDVTSHTTYNYRLTQMDFDGTETCYTSQVVTLTYTGNDVMILEQNSPNPFDEMTSINFSLPDNMHVKLEVTDVFGNILSTLVNESKNAGMHRVMFNSLDDSGRPLSTGTYLYRLTAGDKVLTGKMSLVR